LAAVLGADPGLLLWLLGGLKVASPGLGGGQVAILRLHAAIFYSHVTVASYTLKKEQRIAPMNDLLLAQKD
jgi:hypothetical protein